MTGLEPTTFCTARTGREPTEDVRTRQTAWLTEIRMSSLNLMLPRGGRDERG